MRHKIGGGGKEWARVGGKTRLYGTFWEGKGTGQDGTGSNEDRIDQTEKGRETVPGNITLKLELSDGFTRDGRKI